MRTYQVLFEKTHVLANMPETPVAAWTGQVSLDEQIEVINSHDEPYLIEVDRYVVHEVLLPRWLPLDEWLKTFTLWRNVWYFGADLNWPPDWQRWLAYSLLTPYQVYGAITLLKTKRFQSEFRHQMQTRLTGWLAADPADRDRAEPFSHTEWIRIVTKWDRQKCRSAQFQLKTNGVRLALGVLTS